MIAGLLLLVMLAGGIWAFSQYEARRRSEGVASASSGPNRGKALQRWVDAELISAAQADAITVFEQERSQVPAGLHLPIARSSKVPAVAESLGYLGAVLATTGLVVVLSRSWSDLAVGGQLGIAGLAAILGIGGGSIVEETADPALARLRWALWTMGTAAVGVVAWVVADPWAGLQSDQQVGLLITAAVAVASGLLWMGRVRPVQQLTFLSASLAAVGFAAASATGNGVAGIALWLAAAAVLGLTWTGRLASPPVGSLVGSAGLLAGGFVMGTAWQAWGMSLASLSALGLLVAAGWRGMPGARSAHLTSSALGLLGLLVSMPQTVGYLAGDGGLATGVVVFVLGAALLAVADRGLLAFTPAYAVLGSGLVLIAPGIVATQFDGAGLLAGLALSIGFLVLGSTPGRALLSAVGLLGLLGYVPSTLLHFFPGRSKAPLAILVTGLLLVVGAVVMARRSGQIRKDVAQMGHHGQHGLHGQPG